DKDGRIRASELLEAVRWAAAMLVDPDELVKGGDTLPFAAIADDTLRAAAKRICANLGLPEARSISLENVAHAHEGLAGTRLNGDGVVIVESADDESTGIVIREVGECMGTVMDRSGKPGIDQAKTDAFFEACAASDDWHRKAEADRARVLPLGDATAAAGAAGRALRERLDDYLSRCRVAALGPPTD